MRVSVERRGDALCTRSARSAFDDRLARQETLATVLRRGFELLARNAAQLEKTHQRFFDQIIRARCAGGDADHDRSRSAANLARSLPLLVQIVMLEFPWSETRREALQHKISRQLFLAHLRQMRSVRAVVAAHHQQQIHLHVEQLAQRILPFLGRAANRVEEPKILRGQLRPVAIDDRLPNPPLHFFRLAAQHRRLVRHAHRLQMHIGIEPGRIRAFELFEERLLVAAMPDVIANVIGVGESQHHQIMSLAVAERARTGRLGFFVLGLAVNDRRGRFAGVFAHPFPDAHHVAAGGIDNLAAAVLDLLQDRQFGPERRHDDHVVRLQDRKCRACLFFPVRFLMPNEEICSLTSGL